MTKPCRYKGIVHHIARREAQNLLPLYKDAAELMSEIASLTTQSHADIEKAQYALGLFRLKHPFMVEEKTLRLMKKALEGFWDNRLEPPGIATAA